MITITTSHHTVTLARRYEAAPERVFACWRDPEALGRWYVPGDASWDSRILDHDFRVGGRKRLAFGPRGGARFTEDCRYEDIVENARLCFSMTIANEKARMTTSMVTVELRPEGAGTELRVTDQLVVLDGSDGPSSAREREAGWIETIGKLVGELRRPS